MGKAIAVSVLDVLGCNPASRLGPPEQNGVGRLRATVQAWVRTQERKQAGRKAKAVEEEALTYENLS